MNRPLHRAGSFCLLVFFFFLAGCNNTPERTFTTPSENENLPDTANNDTVQVTTSPQSEHTFTVEISKMKFNPGELTVHKGDTVVWINNDITNHCVTDINKAWTSSTLLPGQSFKKVINSNVDYYCALHLVMKGKIDVQ